MCYEFKVIFLNFDQSWLGSYKKTTSLTFVRPKAVHPFVKDSQEMAHLIGHFSQDGIHPSQRNPAATNKSIDSQKPRQFSHSQQGRAQQEIGTASGEGRGRSGMNLEAGSSSHHAEQSPRTDDGKYNKIKISNLLNANDHPDDSLKFICKINDCNKKFFSDRSLKIHQGLVHPERTSRVCAICSAIFANPSNMRKHVRASLPIS